MTATNPSEGPVHYWKADPRLAPYVTGYHRYRVAHPLGLPVSDIFFPSWAVIRFSTPESEPWSLRIGSRTYKPMPSAALTGPTSRASYVQATRGTLIGIGILPAGWARLFGGNVSVHSNRVVPLTALVRDAEDLCHQLADAPQPGQLLDAWLLDRLHGTADGDPVIPRIYELIDDPKMTRVEMMAETLGITHRALATSTRIHFGFTPKVLLRRGRFLRALASALQPDDSNWGEVLAQAGYWDRSHFLRDSHLFLGCSIRDFLARRGPLNGLAMKVRSEVLGSPV